MDIRKEALKKHYEWAGKIEVVTRCPVDSREDLSLAYTPGVAEPCLEIQRDPIKSYNLTRRHNLVAVVTDGSAVLGLGDIGPEAGMPVMEGKCALFKQFADVDAFPICIKSKDVDEIVRTVYLISGSFGGINLEDIAAPRCFEIEHKLKELCDIPVFHDDQHGTAIVVGAALLNALKIVGKNIHDIRVAMSGAGAAGISIAKHLIRLGVDPQKVVMCNIDGTLCKGSGRKYNHAEEEMVELTNGDRIDGKIADAMKGADLFVGVSAPGVVTPDMIKSMAKDAIVFPMANPTPEIDPLLAKESGARIVGTGRSDFPNQINNVLAFPGIFRGALDCRATCISEEMKVVASLALASLIPDDEITAENIIAPALDKRVAQVVAQAVVDTARKTGIARI